MLVVVFLIAWLTAYVLSGLAFGKVAKKAIDAAINNPAATVTPDRVEAINSLHKKLKSPFLKWRLPDYYEKGIQVRLFGFVALPLILLGLFGPDAVIIAMLGFNLGSVLRAVHTAATLEVEVRRIQQNHPEW